MDNKTILVLNGPNLNLLGIREPGVYGSDSYEAVCGRIREKAVELGLRADCDQSNSEGGIIDRLHAAMGVYDGVILNAGAYTHYSYAIHDAITSVDVPVVEIHISDISKREDFRSKSVLVDACIGQVKGLGKEGYLRAVDLVLEHLAQ